MSSFILISYFSILGVLCVYGAHRFYLTFLFNKHCKKQPQPKQRFESLPEVTVQLPLFNEKFVVERLIDACIAIDYPKDKLYIQVLDDSTDETRELAQAKVKHYQQLGFQISYIHRVDRTGYKAGALENGLTCARGDFVAVFDADFVPTPDVLQRTIHYFSDPGVGMVQARWEHLNRDFSTLTRVQAMMLDAHFIVEHNARCYSGCFFNFNGTAGIWRKQTIIEAGGWEHDTLTEDLDLSYRAQLKGWRFVFVPHVACPAELPTEMKAFKSQQHRWAKGSIQVMLKILPKVWRSKQPLKVKLEATFHLTGNIAYLLMVANSVFFVIPSMMLREHSQWWEILFVDGPLFLLASISFIHFYLTSQTAIFQTTKGRKRFIPVLMAVGLGLGVNNSRAVVEALAGKQSAFVRTPKRGRHAIQRGKQGMTTGYKLPTVGWGYFELALGLAYTVAIVWAVANGVWASIPFLALFQNGFLFVGLMTILEERRHRNGGRPRALSVSAN